MDLEAVFQTGLLVSARTVLTDTIIDNQEEVSVHVILKASNGTQSPELSIVNELHSRDVCAKNPFAED